MYSYMNVRIIFEPKNIWCIFKQSNCAIFLLSSKNTNNNNKTHPSTTKIKRFVSSKIYPNQYQLTLLVYILHIAMAIHKCVRFLLVCCHWYFTLLYVWIQNTNLGAYERWKYRFICLKLVVSNSKWLLVWGNDYMRWVCQE